MATYTKPAKVPRWNDDLTNNVEPPEGKKDIGWVFEEVHPSTYENWRTQLNGDWWKWIDERIIDYDSGDIIGFTKPIAVDSSTNFILESDVFNPKINFRGIGGDSYIEFNETLTRLSVYTSSAERLAVTGAGAFVFDDFGVTGGARIGFAGIPTADDRLEIRNTQFYLTAEAGSGNPRIYFAADDYVIYNRANDAYEWRISDATELLLDASGLRIANGLYVGSVGGVPTDNDIYADGDIDAAGDGTFGTLTMTGFSVDGSGNLSGSGNWYTTGNIGRDSTDYIAWVNNDYMRFLVGSIEEMRLGDDGLRVANGIYVGNILGPAVNDAVTVEDLVDCKRITTLWNSTTAEVGPGVDIKLESGWNNAGNIDAVGVNVVIEGDSSNPSSAGTTIGFQSTLFIGDGTGSTAYGFFADVGGNDDTNATTYGSYNEAKQGQLNYAVYGIASGNTIGTTWYGGWFIGSTTRTTGNVYGARGQATGGNLNYGLYGTGSGATTTSYGLYVPTGTKTWVNPHPVDPEKSIVYNTVEAAASLTVCRGRAFLSAGTVSIAFPEHFTMASSELGDPGMEIHVVVTPRDASSTGLAVISSDLNGFTVQELAGGTGSYAFDWVATGIRRGYEDLEEKAIIDNVDYVPGQGNLEDSEQSTDEYFEQMSPGLRRIFTSNGVLAANGQVDKGKFAQRGWPDHPGRGRGGPPVE